MSDNLMPERIGQTTRDTRILQLETENAKLREQLQAALDALTEQQSITVEWQQAAQMDQVLINLKRAETVEAENAALRELINELVQDDSVMVDVDGAYCWYCEWEGAEHAIPEHDARCWLSRARAALARPSTAAEPLAQISTLLPVVIDTTVAQMLHDLLRHPSSAERVARLEAVAEAAEQWRGGNIVPKESDMLTPAMLNRWLAAGRALETALDALAAPGKQEKEASNG